MRNKFLDTGESGYHPVRKIEVVISGLKYAIRYDLSVTYKLFLSTAVLLVFFFFRQWVDFLLLAAATALMLQAELFNSALEKRAGRSRLLKTYPPLPPVSAYSCGL